jgi:hypothetical protein
MALPEASCHCGPQSSSITCSSQPHTVGKTVFPCDSGQGPIGSESKSLCQARASLG